MRDGKYDEKLEVIKSLMEELMGEMDYGADDLDERLGRKKPIVEAVSIKGELPMEEGEEMMDEMEGEDEYLEDEEEDEESALMRRIASLKK